MRGGLLATFAAFTLTLPMAAEAAIYSNASLKGTYSFLLKLRSANASTTLKAAVGILTFDGAGNVSATYKAVSQGVVQANGPTAGTYSVQGDGLGSASFPGGAQIALLIDSAKGSIATDVKLLETDDTSNEISSGHAVLQSTTPETYSVKRLKGTFSVETNTFAADPTLPLYEGFGVETIDGKGHLSITGAQVYDGVYTPLTVTGTYTVNADGTGTSDVVQNGFHSTFIFVLNSTGGMGLQTGVASNVIVTTESVK
jgi:hypothetical protein